MHLPFWTINQAICLNPNHVRAYYNRGNMHEDLGNIEDARADYQTALQLAEQQGDTCLINDINQRLGNL